MKYRHELKFYASEATLELLRTRISHVVKRDEHQVDTNGYLITSLYFDDIYDHCAKETIGGYDRRHKYRLRIYGHNSDVIKLERKSKIHGMTAKTSAQVTVEECNQMMSGTIPRLCTEYSEQKNQILTEMKINGMRPKCVVQYQREAFIHQIGNVRITFDKNVEGLTLDEMSNLIKGKSGSKVSLTVLRGEEEVTVVAKRGVVEIPSVSSDILEESIGYIKIDSFSATTSDQFSKKLKSMEEKNISSLVIDVRDNPGGKLGQVNKILEKFFSKKTVLYQIVTKDKTTKVYDDTSDNRDYPVVVLVNNGSASAAEILAASFQDNYKDVTIVGTVTYGKGTIQKAIELSSGASIKYTTQKWLTPKGKWINEKGVIPDEIIEQGDKYGANPTYANDVQLQKAVEILKK